MMERQNSVHSLVNQLWHQRQCVRVRPLDVHRVQGLSCSILDILLSFLLSLISRLMESLISWYSLNSWLLLRLHSSSMDKSMYCITIDKYHYPLYFVYTLYIYILLTVLKKVLKQILNDLIINYNKKMSNQERYV